MNKAQQEENVGLVKRQKQAKRRALMYNLANLVYDGLSFFRNATDSVVSLYSCSSSTIQ